MITSLIDIPGKPRTLGARGSLKTQSLQIAEAETDVEGILERLVGGRLAAPRADPAERDECRELTTRRSFKAALCQLNGVAPPAAVHPHEGQPALHEGLETIEIVLGGVGDALTQDAFGICEPVLFAVNRSEVRAHAGVPETGSGFALHRQALLEIVAGTRQVATQPAQPEALEGRRDHAGVLKSVGDGQRLLSPGDRVCILGFAEMDQRPGPVRDHEHGPWRQCLQHIQGGRDGRFALSLVPDLVDAHGDIGEGVAQPLSITGFAPERRSLLIGGDGFRARLEVAALARIGFPQRSTFSDRHIVGNVERTSIELGRRPVSADRGRLASRRRRK